MAALITAVRFHCLYFHGVIFYLFYYNANNQYCNVQQTLAILFYNIQQFKVLMLHHLLKTELLFTVVSVKFTGVSGKKIFF